MSIGKYLLVYSGPVISQTNSFALCSKITPRSAWETICWAGINVGRPHAKVVPYSSANSPIQGKDF